MKTFIPKLLSVLAVLLYASSYSQNDSSKNQSRADIARVFDQYVSYTNALNADGIATCITDDMDFSWLEDGELKYSKKSMLINDLKAFLPAVKMMDFRILTKDIQILGKKQAVLNTQYVKDIFLASGEHFRFDGVMSVVLVKENGTWKFIQGHSSHKMPKYGYPDLERDLQSGLDTIVKQNKLPGITFSVLFDDGQQINLASGYQDLERKIPMEPDSRMLAGSIGKMFVGAIALKLVQENKLNLQDKAIIYLGNQEWFKSFPNHAEIKIINLMNHTSGLPDYLYQDEFLEEFKKNPRKVRSHEEGIRFMSNKPAVHPVDKGWAYSDTNYILLGLIIEDITGTDLYNLLERQLLDRLNLNLTSPSNKQKLENLTQGYVGGQNPFQLPNKVLDVDGNLVLNPSVEWAAGGLISNPKDLTTFIKFIHESNYLNTETKALLKSAVNTKTGTPDEEGYGLGTFVWERNGDMRYGHSGFFPGYLSHVEYSKNNKYAIAIQINTDDGFGKLQEYISRLDIILNNCAAN